MKPMREDILQIKSRNHGINKEFTKIIRPWV